MSTTLLGYAKAIVKIAGYIAMVIGHTPAVVNPDGSVNKLILTCAAGAALFDIINGHETPDKPKDVEAP